MISRNTTLSSKSWKRFVLQSFLDIYSNMTTRTCLSTNFLRHFVLRFRRRCLFRLQFSQNDTFDTAFVLGKARVAPLKQHTITKLQLQAAVLGTRIANFVKRESTLPISQTFFCSDSTTVIQWIRNSHKRQQVCIANRVSEVLETTTVHQWRHCPGDINPADDATRGISITDLTDTWFTGPSFLLKTPENWPVDTIQLSSMLSPAALNSHKQSTSPSTSQSFLLGFALYVSPLSFTAPFVFFVISSKTPEFVPH